ncbi:ABC transporter ATP-binding protein [Aminobacter sp. AP02]|uniref:ABC transporter ATP-binding protein n=1 Tax=Aminobacter sp. AP02 TaxID=2135737 RepID=UPI000D6C667F|nr:ABC transporter ATP-binding protein [Aminobacter sp. AP02]PWK76796.1 branched-chain amino acid transport system ATP-binding protein [Aminobacter sp. AP02]
MIRVNKVRAGYGDGPDILQGIDLTASGGEIVTILGPNGCGKSTLLKCIAGFVRPRGGAVEMEGRDVSAVPVHEKVKNHRMGFVPQTDNVFSTLTVADNILLGARHLPVAERNERYAELMAQYPSLASKQERKASALSGGERQILSLARALISNPKVLLLDEPSAGLSPLMMHEVFAAIAEIRDRTGMCIVMVEQNAFEALGVADRAYVLSLGKVAIEGRAADLLADPAMRHLYLGGEPPAAEGKPRFAAV